LGTAKRVYVSPDGVLNEVALGVIPLADGELLMDSYDLRLVSSTKELLQSGRRTAPNSAVLIGNPTFELSATGRRVALASLDKLGKEKIEPKLVADLVSPSTFSGSQQSRGLRGQLRSQSCPDLPPGDTLCPLKGTQREVEAIFSELKTRRWEVAAPYTQERALKEVVTEAKHPRVLHLATHGFFPPQQERLPGELRRDQPSAQEDPMLRSGLFFAGAERALRGEAPVDGLEDGVLTAYEASTLDLEGTELVVLSACGTGLGEMQAGEGVFGLRRALQEAGAQSVLMTLWSVPDQETQQLMTLFYGNWLAGKDKPTALREAQQQLRQQVKKRYGRDLPFYWGAFVLVGR
jgi:CHAT domain-containing protein